MLIDAKTQQTLGQAPYDRAIYAKAIDRAADGGAKGVVLQLFFDQPRGSEGDQALAKAMTRTKVILQARIDDSQANPNPLPDRFTLQVNGHANQAIGGGSGWIPLPQFTAVAAGVGFVDISSVDEFPILEWYRGNYVKSLPLCCLELAAGQTARIQAGEQMQLAGHTLKMNSASQVAVSFKTGEPMNSVSLSDFIAGTVAPEKIKDKVILVGYDGSDNLLKTAAGNIPAGRVFYYGLLSLYQQLEQN